MKHTIALVAAVLILALLALLRSTATPRAARAAAALPFPDAPSLPDAAAPGAAERFSYDFSLDQEIEVEAWKPAATAEGQAIELPRLELRSKLSGTLLVTVLPADTLALEILEVRHEGAPGADALELMRGEILVRGDTVRLPEGMDARGRLLWRQLLGVWPGRPEAGTRDEEDSTGLAVVECVRESANVWLRRKVAYRQIRTSGRAFRGEASVSGETRIEMDGLPARVEGAEAVALRPAHAPAMRSAARFHFVRTASEFVACAPRPTGGFEPRIVAPAELAPRREPSAALEDARQAVAKLRTMEDQTTLVHHDALTELVEALEESAAAVEELMGILRAGGADDGLAQQLVVALAAAGSGPAQGALAEILLGSGHLGRVRRAAIVASLQIKQPAAEIDAALEAIHRESGDAYALGALAAVGDRVRGMPARFRAIERIVLGQLAAARDGGALCVALEAVGNLGPDQMPERVKEAAARGDAEVRRAAAHSLLRVRDPRADCLLATLLGDADARVRAAAVETLVRRGRDGLLNAEPLPAPLPDLLAGIARNDEDVKVREFARSLAGL